MGCPVGLYRTRVTTVCAVHLYISGLIRLPASVFVSLSTSPQLALQSPTKMHLVLFLLIIPLYWFVSLLKITLHHRSLFSIPGPLTTRFTKLWYFNRVRLRHFEHDNIQLHEKYGPVVRIAPDHYSIRDRSAVRTVYGKGSRFAKSAWYEGWKHPDPNRWTLFPDRDIRRHGTPHGSWLKIPPWMCQDD